MYVVNRTNPGLNALAKAIELEAKYTPFSLLTKPEMFMLVYMAMVQDVDCAVAAVNIMKKLELPTQ